jgi:hypothetical protein
MRCVETADHDCAAQQGGVRAQRHR